MTESSPAAKAIRAAVQAEFARSPAAPTLDDLAAAVLRAAVEQVAARSPWPGNPEQTGVAWTLNELQTVAAELAAELDPTTTERHD